MKALVILSGGADSATMLAKAVRDLGRENVITMSVDYGQRHGKELNYATSLSAYYQVPQIVKKATEFAGSDSKMFRGDIPSVSYDELAKEGKISPTYVPLRNALLIVQAAIEAMIRGFDEVWIGVHKDDGAFDAYPDCREDFVGSIGAALFIGSGGRVRVKAPFNYMTKAEIILLGSTMQVPYRMTWSCYRGLDLHCGVCPTCRARKEAFKRAGVIDPTVYEVI